MEKEYKITTEDKELLAEVMTENDRNWYAILADGGAIRSAHNTGLSSILQCGEDPSDYGILIMIQCGYDDIDEALEVVERKSSQDLSE